MPGINLRAAQPQDRIPAQVTGGEAVAAAAAAPGSMESPMQNQVQQVPIPMVSNSSQVRQQFLSQNVQNNIPSTGVLNTAGLTSALPSVGGMSQGTLPTVPVSGSSSQTGNASGGAWEVEVYQKIKSMHEMYFPELTEMYQRMAAKLQQHDALPQQPKNEQLDKLRFLKIMLERLILFLRTNKNEIQPHHKEKIVGVEKQIVNILNANRLRTPVSSSQQGQFSQPHMHAM